MVILFEKGVEVGIAAKIVAVDALSFHGLSTNVGEIQNFQILSMKKWVK